MNRTYLSYSSTQLKVLLDTKNETKKMLDLEQLQTIAQLVDKIELLTDDLDKAYANNDAEEFNKVKKEILDAQAEISAMFGGPPTVKG